MCINTIKSLNHNPVNKHMIKQSHIVNTWTTFFRNKNYELEMNKTILQTNFLCLKISQGLWQLSCYTDKNIALELSYIVSPLCSKLSSSVLTDINIKIILVLLVVNQSITVKLLQLYQIKVGLHYAQKHLIKFGIKTSLSEKELTMT